MLAQARDQHPDLKNALELIVKSGGKELAYELEEKGYDWIKQEQEV